MRFEVPQFIEIEDKIFGPFTWRQFVYLLGGAGAAFMLYAVLPFAIFLLAAAPIVALAAALAFYQVNNRPFIIVVEACFNYFTGARLYLWQKIEGKPKARAVAETPAPTYLPPGSSGLASLSRQLEINALGKKR